MFRGASSACLATASVAAMCAVVLSSPARLLLETLWGDEDNPFSGVQLGSPGVLRVRLWPNGERSAAVAPLVYATNLDALIRQARSRYSMDVDRVVTTAGDTLRTLEHPDGSSCIADELRCVHDGATLYAVRRGDVYTPPHAAGERT